jgi:catalase
MESVIGSTIKQAGETLSGAMSSNKKLSEMKPNIREVTKQHLTNDDGVKAPSHDIWLSASTGDRVGPQLLEDNFSREKVSYSPQCQND